MPRFGSLSMTASTAAAPADEVTPYARKALIASTAGYAMDGFDFLILGFMLAAIRADLGLSQSEAASLATWTLLGAVAGGIGFGILSDHLGRVRVLTWTILLFAVFTGLSALAQGYWDLALYRAVAGLGLGGEFGIGMALAAEAWPAAKRARVVLCRARLAGGRAHGGARHADASSGDRLARDVRRRARAGRRLVPDPPRCRRAAALRRAGEGRKIRDAHHGPLAAPREGRSDREDQPRHAHPLLGAELRLLRHHDLDAGVSRAPVRLRPAAGGGVDLCVDPWHGVRHLAVRRARRPHWAQARVPRLSGGRCRDGRRLLAAQGPDRGARRRRRHGDVRQRHARRLRHAHVRALPDRGPRDGAERAVQSRPRRRRLRPPRHRRPRQRLLMADGDRAAGRDLRPRHAGDGAAYSG